MWNIRHPDRTYCILPGIKSALEAALALFGLLEDGEIGHRTFRAFLVVHQGIDESKLIISDLCHGFEFFDGTQGAMCKPLETLCRRLSCLYCLYDLTGCRSALEVTSLANISGNRGSSFRDTWQVPRWRKLAIHGSERRMTKAHTALLGFPSASSFPPLTALMACRQQGRVKESVVQYNTHWLDRSRIHV